MGESGVQSFSHSRTGVAGLLPLRHLGSTHLCCTSSRPACALAFHGTFDHTLDAKNRLTVPSKFRSALAGKVFLVKGADPCLSVFPEETYTAMTSQALAGLNPLSAQARELSRLFYANAMEVELDGAGRIMLPARFLDAAGIGGRELVVAGAGPCLELWDRTAWKSYDADLAQRAPDLTASLGHPA